MNSQDFFYFKLLILTPVLVNTNFSLPMLHINYGTRQLSYGTRHINYGTRHLKKHDILAPKYDTL